MVWEKSVDSFLFNSIFYNIYNKIKKYLARFIAIFFPKSTRDKVRNCVLYPERFFHRYTPSDDSSKNFKYYLSFVAICKNESKNLPEWIEFHRLVGVEHFYIYDNESNDNLKEILSSYIKSGVVEYTYWSGIGQQRNMYNDCLLKHKYDTKWLAYIDIDEFIVPNDKNNILDILKDYDGYAGLSIHWVMYGSNGYKTKQDGLVIERFTKRASDDFVRNMEIKSIINPRFCVGMDVHKPYIYKNYYSVDENYNRIYSHKNNPFTIKKIRINHYFCKSWEEYLNKQKRGDSMIGELKHNSKLWFDFNNRNDVEDLIMKPYVDKVKKIYY